MKFLSSKSFNEYKVLAVFIVKRYLAITLCIVPVFAISVFEYLAIRYRVFCDLVWDYFMYYIVSDGYTRYDINTFRKASTKIKGIGFSINCDKETVKEVESILENYKSNIKYKSCKLLKNILLIKFYHHLFRFNKLF